jgi:hypothetical protein
LAAPFKSQARLEAEIVFLRHQLNVLRRRIPANPRLTVADRLLLVWLYRLVPSPSSSNPRRSSDGIDLASACIGAGNRALGAVVRRFR